MDDLSYKVVMVEYTTTEARINKRNGNTSLRLSKMKRE